MGVPGRVNPATSGGLPGRGPGGSLAALPAAVVRAPFTARAARDLLFCLAEAALGLAVLAAPFALAHALGFLTRPESAGRGSTGQPAVFFPLVAVLLVVLALLVIALPRIGRWLGAAHRHLAPRLLGAAIGEPAPLRPGRGLAGRRAPLLRDG